MNNTEKNITHFTPLKNLPCCYYWKDFDRTLNWHLGSLLSINIERCFNDCASILNQLDFAQTKEKASYYNVNICVLEDIFEALYPVVFSFNEFLSLVRLASYQTLFLVDSPNLTEIPLSENFYSYVSLRFHYSSYPVWLREFKIFKDKENFFEKELIKNEEGFKKEEELYKTIIGPTLNNISEIAEYNTDDSIFNFYCSLFGKIKRFLMELEGIYRNRIAHAYQRGCKSDFAINPECITSAKSTQQKIILLKDILVKNSKYCSITW